MMPRTSDTCALQAARWLQLAARRSAAPRIVARNASANTKATSGLHNPTPVASPSKPKVASYCEAGKPLKGLGYIKDKPEPVAMPDSDYPDWLWTLLDPKAQSEEGRGVDKGQDFRMTARTKAGPVQLDRKQLRKNNKEAIRASNFLRAQ